MKLNGQFLDNLSHQTVISLFRRAGDKIKLRVEKQALQKIEVRLLDFFSFADK